MSINFLQTPTPKFIVEILLVLILYYNITLERKGDKLTMSEWGDQVTKRLELREKRLRIEL